MRGIGRTRVHPFPKGDGRTLRWRYPQASEREAQGEARGEKGGARLPLLTLDPSPRTYLSLMLPQKLGPKGSGGLPGCVFNAGSLLGFSSMSQNDEQSPDEPLGTETFEQGDEALDEESRLDPDFLEEVERDPSLDPTLLVDDLELEEAGATFDDPEAMATLDGGIDDPDGVGLPREGRIRNGDEEGWDLDA